MSKRSNGSVRRRASGRYQARFRFDGIVHASTHDTRGQALDWLTEMRERHRLGRLRQGLDPTTVTLGAALERYAREISPQKKNARKEISTITRLIRDERALCAIPLGHVLIADLNDYVRRRTSEPSKRTGKTVKDDTVRNDLAVISHLFTVARARWGYEGLINPVCPGLRPKPGRGRDRRVTPAEEALLYGAATVYQSDHEATVPIGLIIRFAILTAMRRSEIAALDWKHMNWGQRLVTAMDTKNGTTRCVPLLDEAYELLLSLGPKPSGSIFGTSSASIGTAFHRVKTRCGLHDMRFHDLRHEATSRFMESAAEFGLTESEIAEITGHKSFAMLKRYTHLLAARIAVKLRRNTMSAQVVQFECLPDPSVPAERRGANGRFVVRPALPGRI